ncbi:MAG: 2-C-methyl-D-erythritol 2,4-cyclodiphosphate synthase [Rikenellaceae bacterium]|nr:2-C-methyl-D-erythritol 2,4-cyclodiphosphate synthase [Rikenellaceae bacterium]
MRIGHGYDVHALGEGLPLIIGGVAIDHEKGFVAHSDGDVLAHALSDALLGALALGDIGLHFPDTSADWKGADSMELLGKVYAMVTSRGWTLGNADMTVLMQRPKLRPHIDRMRGNIARVLAVPVDRISIKATTEERLGFTGAEQGAAAHAVVLLMRG